MKKSEDFRTSGTWSVTIRDVSTGNMEDHEFDAVMLCTGHHADKNIPDFEGIYEFQYFKKCMYLIYDFYNYLQLQ